MIRVARKDEIDRVLRYLEQDLQMCLYAYIDIKKYGTENPNLTVFIQSDEKTISEENIQCVVMKYYRGLQIYTSNENYDAKELVTFLQTIDFNMINGAEYLISSIRRELEGKQEIECETGYVMELKALEWKEDAEITSRIRAVADEEFDEVAQLICSDQELGGHYEVKSLSKQLLERRNEKFGRNLALYVDEELACHGATYAEIEEAAVVSGLITNVCYRGKGYAYQLVGKMCNELLQEGKRVFLFYYNDTAGRLYKKLGFTNGRVWQKLVLK